MSRVQKLKHVQRELQTEDFNLPTDTQQIVRVISSRGNNLHEVEPADDTENFLITMPTKFRKNMWIKRGDCVLVEPIEEGDKVKAEIVRVLTADHQKHFSKEGVWPKKFTKKRELEVEMDSEDDELVKNTNRKHEVEEESEDSSSSEND